MNTNKAYEMAREVALSGDYTLLSEILCELNANWPSTYNDIVTELKETIQWSGED